MEWFLITDNEHLGPFTEEVLHQLFENGEIDKDSRVWKEGWEDSKSYQDTFINSPSDLVFQPIADSVETVYEKEPEANIIKDEDLPPALPPEITEQQQKYISEKEEQEQNTTVISHKAILAGSSLSENEKNNLGLKVNNSSKKHSPLAVKKVEQKVEIKKTKPIKESSDEISVDDVFDESDLKNQEKRIDKILRYVSVIAVTLVIILPIFFYFNKSEVVFSRPSTMSLEDYERLVQNSSNPSRDIQFAFSLASDKRTLWISTNISLEGEVFLNLKSKRRRILGNSNVEVKAKGVLRQKLITLKEFQFVQGTKFVDGYYDAEIYTVEDLSEPIYNRFFEPREKQFRYLNDVLITSLHPVEFEKELSDQNKKRNSTERKFWEELKEEYRTVKGITLNIKDSLDAVFNEPSEKWLMAVAGFEKNYKSNYGVFFTSFVQAIEGKYDKLSKQNFNDKMKILSEYKKVSELSKEIGEDSMSVLEDLKSTDVSKMSPEQYQNFKYNTLLKFNLIISQCEKMIDEL